jgi:hypothetical protein
LKARGCRNALVSDAYLQRQRASVGTGGRSKEPANVMPMLEALKYRQRFGDGSSRDELLQAGVCIRARVLVSNPEVV